MIGLVLKSVILLAIFITLNGDENNNNNNHNGETGCVDSSGQPQICYPPFQNFASAGRKVIATNTCGIRGRQKYCIGLSSAEMRSRCAYCDKNNVNERHSPDFLTDQNPNNWWQSETWADNRELFKRESINLTIDLGKQFHVTFLHLQFKSPRPSAMVLYKKYDNNSPWQPWQYFASDCLNFFNIPYVKGYIVKRHDEVLCTEDFSSLNEFYNGIVMFATIYGRPGSDNFFANQKLMDWATASQIRIELRKMHTFGEQNDEEELLMTYFYAIKNLQIAGRCWCNGHGNECRKSTGEGLEPQLYCVCHPSHHTVGQSCEKCDNFYQDRPWKAASTSNANTCQRCNCNGNSESCIFNDELYIKSGNISGGLCLNCKGNTKGPHCEECTEGFYKNPDQPNRCIPCNCDPIGRVSPQCNSQGVCTCQPGIEGDKCTRCKRDYFNFGSNGCQPCNCHLPGVNITERLHCNPSTGTCYCKKNVQGEKCDGCVAGFFALTESDPLGCRPCFCFAHTKDCTMAKGFLLTRIESDFIGTVDSWKYGIGSLAPTFNPMLDITTSPPSITWFIGRDDWRDDYFFSAPKKFLGNRRLSYNLNLKLTLSFGIRPDISTLNSKWMSMINDVQLISDTLAVSVPFDIGSNTVPNVDKNTVLYTFRLNEESGLWRDKMDYFRFNSILSNLEAIKIRLTNPSGYVRLHKVALETALDSQLVKSLNLSLPAAESVEKCLCPPQYTGLSCENCAPGYHREYSKGSEFIKCIKCSCNNQSDTCDVQTGVCHCKYNSIGDNCDKCAIGYYGDPTSNLRNVCKPCGCPGGTACELIRISGKDRIVCTDCPNNLGGYRCDRCRDNFFGNPKLNITCKPCECNGNVDYFSSCDTITGKCPKCIYNSAGDNCETCKPGYFLLSNERAPNRCKRCICNPHGSLTGGVLCDINTGNCFCKKLVIGQKCDSCKPGYFNLTVNEQCQPCNCLPIGSIKENCHQTTGQCKCKPGVTGLRCDRCEFEHFNLSSTGCQKCMCDPYGSLSLQCHWKTGMCSCKTNVLGNKCNQCMENHHNLTTEGCQKCPPCYGLIQKRISTLKADIARLSDSVYSVNMSDSTFGNMTESLNIARNHNETFAKLFQNFIQNYDKIEKFAIELKIVENSLKELESNLTNFKNDKMNERVQANLNDIQNMENTIKGLLNKDFQRYLDLLKDYIKSKNENNQIISKVAEEAKEYEISTNQQKSIINNIYTESEKHLANSLTSFVDLIGRYRNYVNESSQFDIKKLSALSKKIQDESFKNLMEISVLNKSFEKFENSINNASKIHENIIKEINEVILSFLDAENTVSQLDWKFRQLVINLPDLKLLEEQIKNKTYMISLKTRNVTEAQEIMMKLKEAQNNLTDAIKMANKTLFKLEDLIKDFNEVANKSKFEAEEHIKILPYLNTTLQEIILEIQHLNDSVSDTINSLISVQKDYQVIYNESMIKDKNIKKFNNQVLQLLKENKENMNVLDKIKTLSDEKLNHHLIVQDKLNELMKSLNETKSLSEKHDDSVTGLNASLVDIINRINSIQNETESMDERTLKFFSERIDNLSNVIENYYQNEFNIISKSMEDMDREWQELQNESEFTNKEINRLQLIDDHMVQINKNVCYKSGGKTEGRL